ncbi:anaphase promoting complex subunit cdc16 [Podila verticillata]|nr:anaphase promoting complex subunit cdc16 [Podila verticillata]
MPNPQLTLKRTSGGSGSFSLSELSPGSRTPAPKKHPSDPSMRPMASPFTNSPGGRQDAQFYLPSPFKGSAHQVPGSVGSRDLHPSISLESNALFDSSLDIFGSAEVNREQVTIDCLRTWRTDATHQHLYGTAAYWGDKVLSLTDDSNDVFWLSQIYFLTGQYGRAVNLLQQQSLMESSVACRFLAIQCMIRMGKWSEAMELLGEVNHFASTEIGSVQSVSKAEDGVSLEASMCYLRGMVFKNLNNIERAKECFQEALKIDVKCYDALDCLISNNMLTVKEERDLIDSIQFNKQLHEHDVSFIKMLYESKLKKFDNQEEQNEINTALTAKFQRENADLLYSKAEIYFAQYRFNQSLECTKRILKTDKFNLACLPMHLVSLYELDLKNDLFSIAHELVDLHPKSAVAWFAVGVYYYLTNNMIEARRYFGKASMIDPHFGPAWIGFGHSFAAEGEHDQAIAAYATSSKLFQGSHLGSMYIGMQHLQQSNVLLAQKYFTGCLAICDTDPVLLNEVAVMHFNLTEYDEALDFLNRALKKLEFTQRKNIIWETAWLNLAHTYRKLGNYDEAEKYFLKVDSVALGATKAAALVGLGFIYQIMGQLSDAIEAYHKVLAIRPSDQIASDMLQMVLEDKVRDSEMTWMQQSLPKNFHDDQGVHAQISQRRKRGVNEVDGPGAGGGVGEDIPFKGFGRLDRAHPTKCAKICKSQNKLSTPLIWKVADGKVLQPL